MDLLVKGKVAWEEEVKTTLTLYSLQTAKGTVTQS